jgi:hypothetical protein
MAEGKGTARIFGRRTNPTIAFNPESEVKAIERRRKADLRAERTRARKVKTSNAAANADIPPTAKPAKPKLRSYFMAGLACVALAMTLVGLAPQVLPGLLP